MRGRHHLLERLVASLSSRTSGFSASAANSTIPSSTRSLTGLHPLPSTKHTVHTHARRASSWSALVVAGSFAAGTLATCEPANTSDQTVSTTGAGAGGGQADVDTETNPYSLTGLTPSASFPQSIVLYQYEVCPFCCKVKAFLDFYNIEYRVVEVDPLGKSELKWSDYKKVPVVLLDGSKQVNNSSSIISQLSVDLQASSKSKESRKRSRMWGGSKPSKAAEEKEETWRRWVDEKLVKAITVNIYRNARESFQTFDYITEHGNFGWMQKNAARIVGATMMWSLSNRLKKKYGIEGDVREALYGLAEDWVRGLDGSPFMGGDRPSLADIEAFGVIRSIVGTDTFNDLQHNTGIGPWWARMLEQVGTSTKLGATRTDQ